MTRRELAVELRMIANYRRRLPKDNNTLRRVADLLEKEDALVEAARELAEHVVFYRRAVGRITNEEAFETYFFAYVAVEALRRDAQGAIDA